MSEKTLYDIKIENKKTGEILYWFGDLKNCVTKNTFLNECETIVNKIMDLQDTTKSEWDMQLVVANAF